MFARQLRILLVSTLMYGTASAEMVADLGNGYLPVRSGPGREYREVGRLGSGARVTVVGVSGNWSKVRLPDGRVGWSHAGYLLPDSGRLRLDDERIRWIVVWSRADPAEAVQIAQDIERTFPSVTVFQSENGYYAVTIGYVPAGRAKAFVADLIARGMIPPDSFPVRGSKWVGEVPIDRPRRPAPAAPSAPRDDESGSSVLWGLAALGVAALAVAAMSGSSSSGSDSDGASEPSRSQPDPPATPGASGAPTGDGFAAMNNGCYWGYGSLCH